MDIKNFFLATFISKKTAFYLNLLGLTLAFVIFYILMAEVKWVNGYDAFHKGANRIYKVYNKFKGYERPSAAFNVYTIDRLLKYSPDVEYGVLITNPRNGSIVPADTITGNENINTQFCYVTKDLPNVFTFTMVEGNTASLTDPANALIPLSLAEKVYGKEQSYVGKTFGDGKSWYLKVGGVYQDFPSNSTIKNWIYQTMTEYTYNQYLKDRVEWSYLCYVKLQKDANPTKVFRYFHVNDEEFNETKAKEDYEPFILLRPLKEIYFLPKIENGEGGSKYITTLFFILACLIVLIAAINFMNFSMAMIPHRIKNINIRKILGASPLALRSTLLAEAFITVFIALLLALGGLTILIKGAYLTEYLKSDISFEKNIILLVYLCGLTFIVTLFSGLYPTYYITSRKPALVVNGNFALSESGRVFRKCLIGIQFTISLIVIIMMLMMNSQNYYIRNSSVGYARDSVFYMNTGQMLRVKYYTELMDKLQSCPYIENASWCEFRLGESDNTMEWGSHYEDQNFSVYIFPVQYNFFSTMGIKISEGRDFRNEDIAKGGAVIFNETARKKYGLKLNTNFNGFWGNAEIIGFIPDVKFGTFKNEVTTMAFYLWGSGLSHPRDYNCAIRVTSPDKIPEVCNFIESVCEELTGGVEKPQFHTKNDIANKAYKEENKQTQMILFGSVLSLFISIIGVFGLVLFETQAKRKEIGIRKVFGASTGNILLMFNKHYLKMLLICFIVAAPISYYLYNKWLEDFAYQVPLQAWLFGIAFLIVAAVVCGTVTIQSWKAARELPVNVLHK